MPRKIMSVVGARPNFMKIAPLLAAFGSRPHSFESVLVHTGQHYDAAMSDVFFEDLGLPAPDLHLGVGAGSQAAQTGTLMVELERATSEVKPDLVLVVGDVNSTLAASLVAAKAGIPVAHVEAGLRSHDRRMPEEINRIVTDALATFLFVTEEDAVVNLHDEGVESGRVFLVGNVMIDTLMLLLPRIKERQMAAELGLTPGEYVVVTLHRPSNVDDPRALAQLVDALVEVSRTLPVVFPAHPRTADRLAMAGLRGRLDAADVRVVEPLPYVAFMSLTADSRLVLTDSGGIQEETTVLGIPCLTLRENTERPVTVSMGTNRLVGTSSAAAVEAVTRALSEGPRPPVVPPLWDGKAAERIADILVGLEWQAYQTGIGAPSPGLEQ